MRIILLFILYLITSPLLSQVTSIKGNAPTHAGDNLNFFKYKDYITYTVEELATCKVSRTGDFKCFMEIDDVTEAFLEIGIFKAYIFLAPGKSYTIELPEKTEKTQQDELNPFFQPMHLHIPVRNAAQDDLNSVLSNFIDTFYRFYDNNITAIIIHPDYAKLENDISKIKNPYTAINDTFVLSYMHYKFGLLRYLAHQFRIQNISNSYFLHKDILYTNPAYMELFNQMYDRYFIFYARNKYGEKLYQDISNKSYSSLLNTLGKDDILSSDTLKEFVVLKNLYDCFYTDDFPRSALLEILDSLIEVTNISMHKTIGINIREKVTKLMEGYSPPHFELLNEKGKPMTLKDFEGHYVYLNFCTSASYTCLREYELLKDLHKRHKEHIKIVTIAVDDDMNSTLEIKNKYHYDWTFLNYGNQPDIVNQYDIRGYPTYYLIGPDGKLLLSPCPSPMENFEYQLFRILKERGDL